MKADKTKVAVDIYGMQYRLSGNESEDHLRRVAEQVDAQMRKIAAGYPRLDLPRLAVLSAVNIADDFLKLQEQRERERSGLEQNRSNEQQALQHKYDELSGEHRRVQEQLRAARAQEEQLKDQLEALRDEYAKLQSEYNEWIQLVSSESEPGS